MKLTYTRRLGKTEYFYWLYDKIDCTNFVLATTLTGKGAGICVEQHLEKTLKSFSRLQESVVVEKNKVPGFAKKKVFNTTVSYRSGNEGLYSDLLKKELTEAFEQGQAPVRALVYYLIPENKLMLAITFNHVFNDARGALTIFKFLLTSIYWSETSESKFILPETPAQEKLLPRSVRGLCLLKHIKSSETKKRNNISFRNNNSISPASYREFRIFRKLVDEEKTETILKYCKSNKISITSFLAAIQCSLVRDFMAVEGEIPVAINIPFDNRDNILPGDMGNIPGLYITIPRLIININNNYELPVIAGEIGKRLKYLKESKERYLTFQFFPAKLFPPDTRGINLLKKSLSKKPVSSMLTNLGKIELKTNDGRLIPVPNIDFHVAPSRDCIVCTSAVSYKRQLSISVGINTAITGYERSSDIFERYISRLLILPANM
jgi:NRPS condensation-like uncharacterized protein